MTDLKPCPFCGEPPLVQEIEAHTHHLATFMPDHPGSWVIECTKCSCGLIFATYEKAAQAWNTRPSSVPVEALKDIHTRWAENLLDDWEVCIEIKTLIDQAERREGS